MAMAGSVEISASNAHELLDAPMESIHARFPDKPAGIQLLMKVIEIYAVAPSTCTSHESVSCNCFNHYAFIALAMSAVLPMLLSQARSFHPKISRFLLAAIIACPAYYLWHR